MRKVLLSFILIFSLTSFAPNKAHALSAKSRAFLIICTYGTVGGALLGFATLAFGTNSRVIAQGASLGLYAGIAFGTYVITSHKKPGAGGELLNDPYQDPGAPLVPPMEGDPAFGDPAGGGAGAFGDPAVDDSAGGFFGQRTLEINDKFHNYYQMKSRGNFNVPVYVNLLNMSF